MKGHSKRSRIFAVAGVNGLLGFGNCLTFMLLRSRMEIAWQLEMSGSVVRQFNLSPQLFVEMSFVNTFVDRGRLACGRSGPVQICLVVLQSVARLILVWFWTHGMISFTQVMVVGDTCHCNLRAWRTIVSISRRYFILKISLPRCFAFVCIEK